MTRCVGDTGAWRAASPARKQADGDAPGGASTRVHRPRSMRLAAEAQPLRDLGH
jgi:hypothetical protein